MLRLIMMMTMTIGCLTMTGETAKCDDNIINKIREIFWNKGYCIPRELKRTDAFLKTEFIVRTSKDYYPNEDNITCICRTHEGPNVTLYVHYEDGTRTVAPLAVSEIIEQDGVTTSQGRDDYRYYLYANKFGISPFYRCSKAGESGDAQGVIKVSALGYDKEALAQSVKDMECLGIHMSDKVFKDSCAP